MDIRTTGLMAQVTLDVGGQLITSIITSGAVHEMGLKKGQIAAALIKATEVMILRVRSAYRWSDGRLARGQNLIPGPSTFLKRKRPPKKPPSIYCTSSLMVKEPGGLMTQD